LSRARILIVDDEPGIRESLSAILEDEGYEAETAASGEECLEALRERSYALVLLDIWLPGVDGISTLEGIRGIEELQRPEVVVISGHGTVEVRTPDGQADPDRVMAFVEYVRELVRDLLNLEQHEAMRLAQQTNRARDL